ncbi:MAG: spermidine synthase [Myxococcota bacterium]
MVSTLLPAIFFLSGCAALLFENLWFYQAGITFGNSVWASSLVLAGFMGGLALGNALAARLEPGAFRAIRTYGLIEAAIGVFGFGLVVGLPALTSLFAGMIQPVLDSVWAANSLRLGFAFLLLLVPSTAMGATLPVMVSALYQRDPRFGSVLGRLYGWNTLGAVVGALAGDLFLIEAVGVRGTGLVAAGISLSVAAAALVMSKRFETPPTPTEAEDKPAKLSRNGRILLVAAGLAGFSLLGLEVAWFRFLLHFLFGSSEAFAVLLATVLAGIGMGGLAGGYLATKEGRAEALLAGTAVLTGIVCLGLYWLYPAGPPVSTLGGTFKRAAPLMFPVAFLSGVLFTMLGEALKREEPRETRAAGLLTLANTTGAMLGPLVVGFGLLPSFGVDRCVQALSVVYLLIGGLSWLAGARPRAKSGAVSIGVAAASLVLIAILFPAGSNLESQLEPVVAPFLTGGNAKQVAMREGLTETIIYIEEDAFEEPIAHRMVTNGYSMSGTSIRGLRYMKLFVYLPMALHPDAKTALLISYGVGSTAKALTNTSGLQSIDVVDTSRDVLEMNHIVYPNESEHPLNDPRIEVHVEDGRYFLETTTKHFDLITGEPPPPKMAGIVTLYTQEYFALVRDRLNEGGIASYWLPAHVLAPDDSKSVIRAFCAVFEDCTLWSAAGLEWILLGTRDAPGPGNAARFSRQWSDAVVREDLKTIGVERPEQLGAMFMAGPEDLKVMSAGAAPLTDDRPKRLSDRRFDLEAGVQEYVPWLDASASRARFANDPWIAKVWPPDVRSATNAYFAPQLEINRVLVETQVRPLEESLPKVHGLLTTTSARALPLWMLGSNALRQRAAETAISEGRETAAAYYELGLGALSNRTYGRASDFFRKSAQVGGTGPALVSLSVYAAFMASDDGRRQELIYALSTPEQSAKLDPWLVPFLRNAAKAN